MHCAFWVTAETDRKRSRNCASNSAGVIARMSSTRLRRKLVLFGRAVTSVVRGSGGRTMRHVSAIGVALLGWVVVTVAPALDAQAAVKSAKASAVQTAHAHGKRV